MNTKTFLATLSLAIGESTLRLRYLLLANSQAAARALAEETCETYFGEQGEAGMAGGWQDSDNLEVLSVREIGLSTYLELCETIPVRRQPSAKVPTLADLEENLGCAAKALTNGLNRVLQDKSSQTSPIGHNAVLLALASSWGLRNWHLVKAKVAEADGQSKALLAQLQPLLSAARLVVDQADAEGCSEDLTVTSAQAVNELSKALDALGNPAAPGAQPSVQAKYESVMWQHRKPLLNSQGKLTAYSDWCEGKGLSWWPKRELVTLVQPSSQEQPNPPEQAPAFDEDIVDQLVDDVRTRGGRHGFKAQSRAAARDLAEQSAEVLGLDASEADLEEATNRLF